MPSIAKRTTDQPAQANLTAHSQALGVSARQLEQRCAMLQSQVQREKDKAREYLAAGNRQMARSCLQRSKIYERQLAGLSSQMSVVASAASNLEMVDGMREAAKAISAGNRALQSVDMDALGDQMMDAALEMRENDMDVQMMNQQMESLADALLPEADSEMKMLDDELALMAQMDTPAVPQRPVAAEPAAKAPRPTYDDVVGKFM